MSEFEFRWRSFCWFEGLTYKRGYGGSLWLRYYREFKWAKGDRRRHREMMELSA